MLTVVLISNDRDELIDRIKVLEKNGISVQVHYTTKNPLVFTTWYLQCLTCTVSTPYVTFCLPNETCLPDYLKEVTPHMNEEYDVILFDQICSLDGGSTRFTINSDFTNISDTVPSTGPWRTTYNKSLSNWSIYKTCIWHTIKPAISDEQMMKQIRDSIKKPYALKKVIYSYCVK